MRNIECIQRLLEKNKAYHEICDWLILNKFTDEAAVKQPYNEKLQAEFIYGILKNLEKEDKLILLYFEWTLLPKETIKITCVTETEEKLFTYGL